MRNGKWDMCIGHADIMERERARGKSQEKQEEARLISLHIRDAGTGELQQNGGGVSAAL